MSNYDPIVQRQNKKKRAGWTTSGSNIFSVTELNNEVKSLLEAHYQIITVIGEVSGFIKARSGHCYFTLKDQQSQIRCALFFSHTRQLTALPENGIEVIVQGRLSLYSQRGDYQLLADKIQPAGQGASWQAFEALKAKLTQAGLFDQNKKQALPQYPQHITIITSPYGAAIHDILSILKRRAPFVSISIIPALVQGENAAATLIQAVQLANRTQTDAVIITRGGGSIEDLWPFNNEQLAKAISRSKHPIVSAVGHETDFSISDFVADYRAPTPSAAAEIISQDHLFIKKKLYIATQLLLSSIQEKINKNRYYIQILREELHHPYLELQYSQRRLTDLYHRLQQLMQSMLTDHMYQINAYAYQIQKASPLKLVTMYRFYQKNRMHQLYQQIEKQLDAKKIILHYLSGKLQAISPLATLARGYSITMKKNCHIITSSQQVQAGDVVSIQLYKGQLCCLVTGKKE